MRRFLLASLVALAPSVGLAGSDGMQLFLKAKEQFRLARYSDSLATLDSLQTLSELAGNESYRAQLAPGLAFYRGACLAALGRPEEARPQLELFLSYEPNASLDPGAFPAKVIASFEEARRSLRAQSQKPAETGPLATAYRAYVPPVSRGPSEAGEDWAESPVTYLLTAQERRDYARLPDAVARSEFITEFWKARDPRPETRQNEAREEFERRVAFADAHFEQDEKRGSLTDRGMVFVLLGPPSWVGRRPLRTGEDTADPSGMSIYSDQDVVNALHGLSGAASAIAWDKMTGPSNRMPDSDGNYREVWHYRRELLPPGVSFLQVDFEFITRKGYGANVWQRDSTTLAALETARESVKTGVVSRAASH